MVIEEADSRGRYAHNPWAIPLKGWIEVLKRTWSEATEDSIGLVAAGVAFYGFLAIAPLLAATILVYGIVAEPTDVGADLRALLTVMPPDAVRLIDDLLVAAVHTSEGKAGFGLIVALAIALYGGMNGANALITALNIAYEEQDRRGFVRVNLLALGMTAAGVVSVVIALGLAAIISHLRTALPEAGPGLVIAGRIASLLAGGLACAAAAATLYRYAPDRRDARWVWLSPGSIAAAALWLVISLGFGVYAARFANYGATYGSASAIIVMLTWLYLSAYILLLGAELNSELEHQTVCDTTKGAPKPLGERGAVVADTVADMPGGNAEDVHGLEGDKDRPPVT